MANNGLIKSKQIENIDVRKIFVETTYEPQLLTDVATKKYVDLKVIANIGDGTNKIFTIAHPFTDSTPSVRILDNTTKKEIKCIVIHRMDSIPNPNVEIVFREAPGINKYRVEISR